MTLDDLIATYDAAAQAVTVNDQDLKDTDARAHRAGIRAVVEALRDELRKDGGFSHPLFNEIPAIAGGVKAAGGSTREGKHTVEVSTVAYAPAADLDVCEWTAVHLPDRLPEFSTQCGSSYVRIAPTPSEQGAHHCYHCAKWIKFIGGDRAVNIEQLQTLRLELSELYGKGVSCGNAGEAPRAILEINEKINRVTGVLIDLLLELEAER